MVCPNKERITVGRVVVDWPMHGLTYTACNHSMGQATLFARPGEGDNLYVGVALSLGPGAARRAKYSTD